MHIFFKLHIVHFMLHIYWHILHIESMTYCEHFTYLSTCHFTWFYAYCAYCHILHTMPVVLYWSYFTFSQILYTSLISVSFAVYSHYCLVPNRWVQLFTYYHLHPSPLFWLLSQEAPRKSADSLRMFKGIVLFSPKGTIPRGPSVELTGRTYTTCACSLRW